MRRSDMKKLYERYRKLMLYGVFGILTTAVNYGSYALLTHCAGFPVAAGNTIAWIISVIFAFVTNKHLVFGSKSMKLSTVTRELLSFVACRLFSGILDMGIMVFFTDVMHYNDLLVKLASNVIVIIINYIFSTFIFARKEPAGNG